MNTTTTHDHPCLNGDIMTNTRANSAAILGPDQVADLLNQPMVSEAICTRPDVSTVVHLAEGVSDFRVPTVVADPAVSWVAEGEEIPFSDAVFGEAIAKPKKLAGITPASSELLEDSRPDAAEAIGAGLARDLARKIDSAYFAATTATNAPPGIGVLAGVKAIAAGTLITSTDVFATAASEAEMVGARITAFVANPADVLTLAKVRKASGSNEPLFGTDPAQPTRRVVVGVPIIPSVAVAAGTTWGVDASRNYVAIKPPIEGDVTLDSSVFFTSDRYAIRARMRVAFAFAHPQAVMKITIG